MRFPNPCDSEAAIPDRSLPSLQGHYNDVNMYLTLDQLTAAMGEGWNCHGYKTSTETFVTDRELIHLTWDYRERTDNNHSKLKGKMFLSFISLIYILDLEKLFTFKD